MTVLDLSGLAESLADVAGSQLAAALEPLVDRMESAAAAAVTVDDGGLISLEELSRLVGVARSTLRDRWERGDTEVPCFSVEITPGTVRYKRAAYVRWLRGESEQDIRGERL